MQALDKYIDLLAGEAQRDATALHNPWIVYPVVPLVIYAFYAFIKWYVLLMPITMPMTLWLAGKGRKSDTTPYKNN